jgi:hypothetical protein
MRTARQVIVALLVGGLFGVPPLFGQTTSDWVGVWRLFFKENPEATAYWVISSENAKISIQQYDATWRSENVTVTNVNGTSLSATYHGRGYKLLMTVTMQGDRFSGTSNLVHVQYKKEEPISGVRVVKTNHWDPLEGIRKLEDPAGVADVSSALRKAALGMAPQKFIAAWDSEIGGPYYVFLDQLWDPDPAQKSEKLRRLYRILRSNQFAENVKTTLALRAQVVKLIKDKQSSFYFANPTVVLPSLGSADVSAMDLTSGKIHIKMEVPAQLASADRPRLKWLIAREQIKLGFLLRFPLQLRTTPIDLIRMGISGYLAADLLGISLPDLLNVTAPKVQESLAHLDAYRKAMANGGNGGIERINLASAGDPLAGQQIAELVCYKFGEQVASRFKVEELAKLERTRLLELANNFLHPGS